MRIFLFSLLFLNKILLAGTATNIFPLGFFSVGISPSLDTSLTPSVDATYSIGSAALSWKDLYIDGGANDGGLYVDGTLNWKNPGTNNLFIGAGCGSTSASGISNLGIGSGTTLGSITSGNSNTIIGNGTAGTALTSGSNNTIVGAGAAPSLNDNNNVAIGASAGSSMTTAQSNICVGVASCGGTTTHDNGICVGPSSRCRTNSISFGVASGNSVNSSSIVFLSNGGASNSLQFGALAPGINNVYLGNGKSTHDTLSPTITFQLTGASGTDIAGSDFIISPGKSTGNANTGGDLLFQTSDETASGTTLQTNTTKAKIEQSTGEFQVRGGTSSNLYPLCVNLKFDYTNVGNVGAGEDTLITYSIPANILGTDADKIEFLAAFSFAANANSKQVKCKYGSTTIFASGAQTQSGGAMEVTASIIRTGAATQKAMAKSVSNAATPLFTDDATYTTPGETLSGAVNILCTGEAVADNDIVEQFATVKVCMGN